MWLRDWKIAINVGKSADLLVLFTTRRIPTPRPLRFLRDKIQWVEKDLGSPLIRDLLGLVRYVRLDGGHPRDSGYSIRF
jgi:hypothetical protein